MKKIDNNLKKAIKDYFKWNGDRKAKAVKWVTFKTLDVDSLLVRVSEEDGTEISCLMLCQNWKDGHWDVSEMAYAYREDEDDFVKMYEEEGYEAFSGLSRSGEYE